MQRLIVAITGASGAVYGVRLLSQLRALGSVETHLMISDAAALNLHHELDLKRADIEALVHASEELGNQKKSAPRPSSPLCSTHTNAT